MAMDPKSRYAHVGTLTWRAPDGTEVPYLARRFLPRYQGPAATYVRARPGERLDQISARVMGDPLAYYRICDAQRAVLNPFELVEDAGARVPVPAQPLEAPSMPLPGRK